MFGKQHESMRTTAPKYGFGSSDRSTSDKVFITEEHNKSGYGKWSPGPVYSMRSTIGPQMTSKNETLPLYSFGSADRFENNLERRAAEKPGPGKYSSQGAIGKQTTSTKRNAPGFRVGSATRDAEAKVYMSEEQSKSNYGAVSPGPNTYTGESALGKQAVSTRNTYPFWGFSHDSRFKYDHTAARIPGAGQYNVRSSYGPQVTSNRATLPKYSFGSSTREKDNKVYLSPEHEKSHYGKQSPGPVTGGTNTAFGKQQLSRKRTVPSIKVGSSKRFHYSNDSVTPGPGAYE